MKNIYSWSALSGFILAPLLFIVGYSFNMGDFMFSVEKTIFQATEYTATVELDFITLTLLLIVVFLVISSILWKLIDSFREKYHFNSVLKMNLFFAGGVVASLIALYIFLNFTVGGI